MKIVFFSLWNISSAVLCHGSLIVGVIKHHKLCVHQFSDVEVWHLHFFHVQTVFTKANDVILKTSGIDSERPYIKCQNVLKPWSSWSDKKVHFNFFSRAIFWCFSSIKCHLYLLSIYLFNCFGTCFNICSILKSKPNIKIPSHLLLPYF